MWLCNACVWVAYQENKPTYLICPDSPNRHPHLFSCKPLTLLQILVNSDVRTSVSFHKIALSHLYWCLNRNQVWVKQHLESILGICSNQMSSAYCLRTLQISSYTLWMTWKRVLIWLFYTSLCLCKVVIIVLSSMANPKNSIFQMQFDPGLTGTRMFPRVLDYRDLCLYNEPRMRCVVMSCCSFLFLFYCVGCPSPHRRIRDMELLSAVNPVPK